MTNAKTMGVHHVGLTTPDLDATYGFFTGVLGFTEIGGVPDYPAKFVSDGTTLITLWQVKDMDGFVPFDRHRNAGLHHIAFRIEDHAALDDLFGTLSARPDVEIECDPSSILEGSSARHFLCSIPGGIRVEFATPLS